MSTTSIIVEILIIGILSTIWIILMLRLELYDTASPKLTDPKGIEESCRGSSFQLAA